MMADVILVSMKGVIFSRAPDFTSSASHCLGRYWGCGHQKPKKDIDYLLASKENTK
jgi:hypothetical protein